MEGNKKDINAIDCSDKDPVMIFDGMDDDDLFRCLMQLDDILEDDDVEDDGDEDEDRKPAARPQPQSTIHRHGSNFHAAAGRPSESSTPYHLSPTIVALPNETTRIVETQADDSSNGSYVYVSPEPASPSNSSKPGSGEATTYGEVEIMEAEDDTSNEKQAAPQQEMTVSTTPQKRKMDHRDAPPDVMQVDSASASSPLSATRPPPPDASRHVIEYYTIHQTHPVVPLGWSTHPGTVKWRTLVKEFSDNRVDYPSWSDDIGTQVYQGLQQAGFDVRDFYQYMEVVRQAAPAGKKQRSTKETVSATCRKASYQEFWNKTKERFKDYRKPSAAGRPTSETPARFVNSATLAPEPQWRRQRYYPITRNTVCLGSQHHDGTVQWRKVVQAFSNDLLSYPTWTNTIADRVKEKLAETNFTPILVFRDPFGRPCQSFQDGWWVLAEDKEFEEMTKNQFFQNRKPPKTLTITDHTQGPNRGPPSGRRRHSNHGGSQHGKPFNGSPHQGGDDSDSDTSDSNSNMDGNGRACKSRPHMQNQMMVDVAQRCLGSSEQEEVVEASEEMHSAASEEEEEDEAEIIWVYDVDEDDDEDSDDKASKDDSSAKQNLPQDTFSRYRDNDVSSPTGLDPYGSHSGAPTRMFLTNDDSVARLKLLPRMLDVASQIRLAIGPHIRKDQKSGVNDAEQSDRSSNQPGASVHGWQGHTECFGWVKNSNTTNLHTERLRENAMKNYFRFSPTCSDHTCDRMKAALEVCGIHFLCCVDERCTDLHDVSFGKHFPSHLCEAIRETIANYMRWQLLDVRANLPSLEDTEHLERMIHRSEIQHALAQNRIATHQTTLGNAHDRTINRIPDFATSLLQSKAEKDPIWTTAFPASATIVSDVASEAVEHVGETVPMQTANTAATLANSIWTTAFPASSATIVSDLASEAAELVGEIVPMQTADTAATLANMTAVFLGWIRHPCTKKWRAFIRQLAEDPEVMSWSDELLDQVKERLKNEGIADFYIHVREHKDKETEISGTLRMATPEEVLAISRKRFRDFRKPSASSTTSKQHGAGKSPPMLSQTAPRFAALERQYFLSEKSVYLGFRCHPGTVTWREVVNAFADDTQHYPRWEDQIVELVRNELGEREVGTFFVFRDLDGLPCTSIDDGWWVLATDDEIREATQMQFESHRNSTHGWNGDSTANDDNGKNGNSPSPKDGSSGDRPSSVQINPNGTTSSSTLKTNESTSNSNNGSSVQNVQAAMMLDANCKDFTSVGEEDANERPVDTVSKPDNAGLPALPPASFILNASSSRKPESILSRNRPNHLSDPDQRSDVWQVHAYSRTVEPLPSNLNVTLPTRVVINSQIYKRTGAYGKEDCQSSLGASKKRRQIGNFGCVPCG